MTILDVNNVCKQFGGLKALQDVSFSVDEGTIFGLMGANGAGKTTLFGVIAGQIRSNGGSITFAGKSLAGRRPDQICRLGLGRTFQIVRPFGNLSVLDNVVVSAMYGSARTHRLADATLAGRRALEDVGLAPLAGQLAASLTLSNQKRLEIARALATGARLVLLDEVMAGLTATEVAEMTETLFRLRQERGLTILIIEHVMGALMKLSDRILVLDHGVPIAMGPPEQVVADENVVKVYFG
ncbi:MAG: ABC transporter ATP-binding protein [Aquamicrobium sp.]|uniref:ABC transporter ATP-binding protein n=1 Tax=Mesorhizobium sp. Pch-S TaxID=2082387 RepID=UPI0010115AB0|nr:ABC transporter ATP-binding protein [Mesorhizobium sp. Pch-S]MBR2686668.1 ABC transporter ATP-binding protein [Aquamicrobium sp.]QAZ42687.1 ABC transporter ATP-binding protein [Mesorhizobium sp. Pch-S]